MPARIVVVLNEPEIAEEAASALGAQGQDALALVDPMTALEALEGAERIEVLVTGLDFAPGKPNGIALGRMARLKRRASASCSSAPQTSKNSQKAWHLH